MNSIQTSFTTISVLALFIFSCIAYVAHAQAPASQERFAEVQALRAQQQAGTSSPARPTPTRATTSVERAERQAEMGARRAALSEQRQERVIAIAGTVDTRLRAIIDRLTLIADRIENRSEQLTEQGADTSLATIALDETRSSLAEATTALESISLETVLVSNQPRVAWQEVRVQYSDVRNTIRTARDHLRAALEALKVAASTLGTPGVNEATKRNTSTSTTSL